MLVAERPLALVPDSAVHLDDQLILGIADIGEADRSDDPVLAPTDGQAVRAKDVVHERHLQVRRRSRRDVPQYLQDEPAMPHPPAVFQPSEQPRGSRAAALYRARQPRNHVIGTAVVDEVQHRVVDPGGGRVAASRGLASSRAFPREQVACSIAALMLVAAGYSQAGFTIRRPADGSVVRETVEFRIPRSSIPETGFVGISLNGRFVEAVAPIDGVNANATDFIYRLDTKAKGIADGPLKIEAVLYVDTGRGQIMRGRTGITVRVDNHSSIRVPAGGIRLRYDLTPQRQYIYGIEFSTKMSQLTDAQAAMGRETNLGEGSQKLRYAYTVIQREPGDRGQKSAIIRMQPMPEKGKDYAILTLPGDTEPKRYFESSMMPIYMKIDELGREAWGQFPVYAGFSTEAGTPNRVDLYALLTLPLLPARGLTVGAPVAGGIQNGALDMDKALETQKFTNVLPGAGKLVALEYQNGVRAARIENSLSVGNAAQGTQELKETYWFSLDGGYVLKYERKQIQTTRVRTQPTGGGLGAGGGTTPEGGRAKPGVGTSRNMNNPPANFMPDGTIDFNTAVNNGVSFSTDLSGTFLQAGGRRGGGGAGFGGQGGPGSRGGDEREGGGEMGFGGNPGNSGANQNRGTSRLMRITTTYTMTLE